ncbi:THO complex subunit 2 [Ceratobasidium sp. 414]|nr:THO complex subunit 2 [Ceratobasidium sp. 414]
MAHDDVVAKVAAYAREWEAGGKATCLQLLRPHMADILSSSESVHMLSAAFFALISAVVVGTVRQSDEKSINQSTLASFAHELAQATPSTSALPTGRPPSPGSPLPPQAHKLSEVLVDVLWTIDSELEEVSVEESRAPPAGDSTQSMLQQRASLTKERRVGDRERLVHLIRDMLKNGTLDMDYCRERFDAGLIIAIKALFRQSASLRQRETKLRTATFYKQTRYNLLREQSEGYSKLVTELYQSVGPPHDAATGRPVETRARVIQRAQETWARMVALFGVFDLDPNRAVDIFLDCFETHLPSHWAFFLELLRCSPWSRAKPHSSVGLQGATEEQTMDLDAEPDWEGLNLDEVLVKAEGRPNETVKDLSTPQGSQCGQILGFKFAYYQLDNAAENAPSRLYMLAALLLREGFIELDDLYPHLSPSDDSMSEFEAKWNSTRPAVLVQRNNALAMAAPLVDDSRGSYRQQASSSAQAKSAATEGAKAREPANQKAQLVYSLLCVGALRQSLTILSKFPWFASAHPDIADALLRLLTFSFEPLYLPISLANRSSQYTASNAAARGKWTNSRIITPIAQTHHLTLWAPVPPPTVNSSFTFFYPKWNEWIPRLRTHAHLMAIGVPLLKHVGLLACRDVALLTKLCRIGKAHLDASVDAETKVVDQDILKDWVDVTRLFLLPSLSMQRSNSVLAIEIWGLLKHADPTLRWGMYGEWQSGNVFGPRISPYANDEYDPEYETPEEKQEREVNEAHAKALMTKDEAARDLLKERRTEVARDTRDLMRRITDKNPTQFARLLAKLSHSNPTITFPAIMKQLMAYDNFAKAVVGISKYLTTMEFDMFTYYLLEAFSDDDRGKVKDDGENATVWLQSLAAFAGQLCRRHAALDSAHILNYMAHQLHNNRYDDLIILRNLISKMTSIDASMDALPDRLLVALRGGPLLQVEMLAPETRGAEGLTPMTQRATARLLDALRRTKLLGPMVVLLAKLRQTSAFANTDRAKHPKILGLIFDECQAVLFQYLELLWSNTPFEEWAAAMPSFTDLVEKYDIEHSIAMHILRPKLREGIVQASESSKLDSSETSKASETAEAIERRLRNELKLQSAKKDQTPPAGGAETSSADAPTEPASEPVAASPWHLTLLPVIKEVTSLLPERVLESVGAPFFVTFWQLSMYELSVPDTSYSSIVTRLSNKIREPIPTSSPDARFLEGRRKRMQQQCELLPQEMKRQMSAKAATAARLRREKNHWFPVCANQNEVASNFVQYCIHPRALLSPLDADFCSHFLKLITTIGTPTANCVKFYDYVFAGHMSSIIFTCSEREARNYGRFLRGVLTDVGAWAKEEKTYKTEVVDKLLPSFLRQWSRTQAMSRNIKASDMIQWDNIRRLVSKWHIKMFKSCVDCLLSGEAMHIRNAIIVLTEVLPVFPMKEISHNSGPAIINAVRELLEKETRPDLFNMAQSYHGQLNSRRPQWETEVRDAGAARTPAAAPAMKPSSAPGVKPAAPELMTSSAKPTAAPAPIVAANGAKNSAVPEPRPVSPKDVEMAIPPSAPSPAPVAPTPTTTAGATTDSADANTKSYVDSLPKPSVVKGRVQRDPSAVSTPPPSSHEPSQPLQPNAVPTEPRRPTPSAPRLDLAKLNGLEPAKSQPTAIQLSARSSRPPTPTGPRKHGLDSPRLGRASMPIPVEPSSTPAAQELRKFSAEKAAEKSAAAAVAAAAVAPTDRTPSRMSSVEDRRSPSPRPSRRNGSADSRVSERTRDRARDRDRERHDDRERERDRDKEKDRDRGDRDKDRDRRYGRSKRGAEREKEKEKDKDYRKRSGDGSRGRGYDDDDEGSVKRHKSGNDEKKRDDRDRHHRDRDKDKHRPREKEHRDRSDRDRDRDRGRSDKDRERREERDLGKDKEKERDRPSGRDRDRDREQKDRDREREKEREGERGRSRRSRVEDTLPTDQAPSPNELTFKPPADPPTGPKYTQSSFPAGLPPKPQSSEVQREPSRSFEPHGRSFDQDGSRQNSLIARLSQTNDQPSTGPSVPQKRGAAEDTGPRGNDRPSKRPQTGYGSGGRGGGGMFGAAIQGMRGQGGNRSMRE